MSTNAPEPLDVTRSGDRTTARFAHLTSLNEYHADQIGKQVDRLLASPRSADSVKAFFHGWLDLDRLTTIVKDDKVFPVGDDLRADMTHETAGTTTITASVADQAQLHSVLAGLRDIGATITELRTTAMGPAARDEAA